MKVCCPCGGHAPTLKDDLPLITQLHQKFSYTTSNIDGFSLGGSVIYWVLTRGLQSVQCLRVDPRNGREEDWTQGGTSMWGSSQCTWRQTAFLLSTILTLQNVDQWELSSSSSDSSRAEKNCKSFRSWQVEIETLKTERLQSITAIFVKKHFFHICQTSTPPFLSFLKYLSKATLNRLSLSFQNVFRALVLLNK